MPATTSFAKQSPIPVSPAELGAWHFRPKAFVRLGPPWQAVRLEVDPGAMRAGIEPVLSVPIGPFRKRWHARITEAVEGEYFVDTQLSGPFGAWSHTHRFLPGDAPGTSVLRDEVEYALPFHPFGQIAAGAIRRDVDRLFAYRHYRTLSDLRRHAEEGPKDGRRLTVVLTGASGLLGTQLEAFLVTGGHTVRRLVRRAPDEGAGEFRWDPQAGTVDAAALEGADAVVHLAGSPIDARWDAAGKRRILDSRVLGTQAIARAMAALDAPPPVLVSASGTGYYGHCEGIVGEDAPKGAGFLADVSAAWEDATQAARDAGIRVVCARIAPVITPAGGALAKMLFAFRAGVGGPIGGGRQGLSWIGLDDCVAALHRAVVDPSLSGSINVAAPEMITQGEFAKILGSVLRRPAFMPIPAFVLRALLGEMATAALEGVRATPDTLSAMGFRFETPDVRSCLEFTLRGVPPALPPAAG